ncbi:pyruvate carboxylase, partial [Burkholderia multivorans]|uniref:biotin carboxylase N-terminal domain-containing protein n=1 Tax=Burkholderia multivorans TaxID=87883 RepID=UPI000DB5904E
AYMIGEKGHPVRAYLSVEEIIRVAKESGADAVYPGYGFLSENPDLARACGENGITFSGPKADVLELAGNKVQALSAARSAGIPVLDSTRPSADVAQLLADAESMEYPLFVKAVAGGGLDEERVLHR